jgi:3-oxoacyl-(acyl-carrier-protein) synthase
MGHGATRCPKCGVSNPAEANFCFNCGVTVPGGEVVVPSRRVVVTGLGAVTPIGLTAELTWQGLLEGRSGVSLITELNLEEYPTKIGGIVRDFEPERYMDRKEARRMGRYCQLAVAAAGMALEDAQLQSDGFDRE